MCGECEGTGFAKKSYRFSNWYLEKGLSLFPVPQERVTVNAMKAAFEAGYESGREIRSDKFVFPPET